jgi:hypothetical protein
MLHQNRKTASFDAVFVNKNGGLGPQSRLLPILGFSDLNFLSINFKTYDY